MIQKKALTAVFASLIAGGLLIVAPSSAPGEEAPPLAGEFADNFTLLDPPVPVPLEVFQDMKGGRVRLADFAGQVVVLNFWATWCPPCVREMPSLDRLHAALREEGLTVVAVSIDRGGPDVIEPFAARHKLKEMGLYWDAKSTLAKAFGVTGLPTTFIIDRQSRIIGAMQGSAEWGSPEALALVRHYLAARPDPKKQSAEIGVGYAARISELPQVLDKSGN